MSIVVIVEVKLFTYIQIIGYHPQPLSIVTECGKMLTHCNLVFVGIFLTNFSNDRKAT